MSAYDKFARLAALKPVGSLPSRCGVLRAPNSEDSLSRVLGAGIAKNRYGEHICVRNWYSTPEFAEPSHITLNLLSRVRDETVTKHTQAALADPTKWLFLDTETTGIAGGTGTYAFLIGIAWWDAGGLQVEQLIMRDFAEEHSILHALAACLAERPVLVTFNGKTFDWPLLENRFTMTRAIRAPRLSAHLDLLHPARAVWKIRLGTVRLVDLEREVLNPLRLGWSRKDDVPTSLIPQFYFDYLRGGPPEPLAGVVRHNQMDLRGLAALFGKLNQLLAETSHSGEEYDGRDLFGLSRFLQRRGEESRAHSACTAALSLGLPAEVRRQAWRELAQLAKRRGQHEQAVQLWQELASDESAGIDACVQLAIHYERRAKDFAQALEFARLALLKIRRSRSASSGASVLAPQTRQEQCLRNRIARLEHRIGLSRRLLPVPTANVTTVTVPSGPNRSSGISQSSISRRKPDGNLGSATAN